MTGPTTQSPTPPGAVAREHPQSEDEQEDEKALGEKRQLDVHERAVEREQYSGGKAGATIAENPRRQHGDEPADDAAESALQQTRNERRVPPQLQQQREEIRVRWAVAGCEPAEHLAFVDVSRPEEKLPGIELRTLEECSVVELRGEPGADGEGDYGDGGEPRPGQAPRRRRARRRDRSADGPVRGGGVPPPDSRHHPPPAAHRRAAACAEPRSRQPRSIACSAGSRGKCCSPRAAQ